MTDLVVISTSPLTLQITSDPAPSLVIQQPVATVVEVQTQGPQGPPGPRGGVTIRTQSIVSSATIVPDSDQYDLIDVTALAVAASIAAPLGTPVNGQRLLFRLLDNGVSHSLTWASAYISGGITLPGATTAGKVQHLGFFYDSNLSKWMSVAGIIQP